MTITDYYERFARCTKTAAGEPCQVCDSVKVILSALATTLPDWENYAKDAANPDPNAGIEAFQQLQHASEACIRAAIYCWLFASTVADANEKPVYPETVLWMGAFGETLSREMRRSGLTARVTMIPRLDVMMFIDPSTKH